MQKEINSFIKTLRNSIQYRVVSANPLDFFRREVYFVKEEILSGKVPKSQLCSKKVEIAPLTQERRRPIPRPNYTIEEL